MWWYGVGLDLFTLGKLAPRVLGIVNREVGAAFFVAYAFVVLLLTAAPLFQSFWLGELVDWIVGKEGRVVNTATILTSGILLMVAVQSLVGKLQGFMGDWMRRLLWYRSVVRGAHAIASLDLDDYRDQDMRETITRARENARWRFSTFADNQALFVLNVFGLIVAVYWLHDLGWWLAAIIAACVPELLVELSASRATRKLERREGEKWRAFWHTHWEVVSSNTVVEHQIAGTAGRYTWRTGWYGEALREGENRLRLAMLGWRIAALVLAFSVLAFATWRLIDQAIAGAVNPGQLTFYVGGLIGLAGTLTRIALNLHELARDGHAISDLFLVFDRSSVPAHGPSQKISEVQQSKGIHPQGFGTETGRMPSLDRAPEIVFDRVAFRHDKPKLRAEEASGEDGGEEFHFEELSLTIAAGEKLVIVGDSGAGKTTFAELISQVRRPTSGVIKVDGRRLSEIPRHEWWESLGVLLQRFDHPAPFTIREILALGSGLPFESLTDEVLWSALERAKAAEVVRKKRGGLNALLGKDFLGGTDLSTGEWQRLRLAALFLRNPWVLILDEPTSALDPLNASAVIEELFNLPDRSLILITHWLKNCPRADRILVFARGKIIEQGTHSELMNLNSVYARLYRAQMGEQEKSFIGTPSFPEVEPEASGVCS